MGGEADNAEGDQQTDGGAWNIEQRTYTGGQSVQGRTLLGRKGEGTDSKAMSPGVFAGVCGLREDTSGETAITQILCAKN